MYLHVSCICYAVTRIGMRDLRAYMSSASHAYKDPRMGYTNIYPWHAANMALEDDVRKVFWGCEQTQKYQLGLANNDPNEPTIHSTVRLKLHENASAKFTGAAGPYPTNKRQELIKHSFSQAWNNRPSIIKQPPKNSQCSTGCTSWKLSPFWPVRVKAFIVIPLAVCRWGNSPILSPT